MSDATNIDDLKRRMEGAISSFKHELTGLRTGRASASLLEPITVDAYGSTVPLNQVANISVPEPRMLSVSVWDKTMVSAVDKAMARENHIPIIVYSISEKGGLANVLNGTGRYTVVSE